VLPVSVTRVVNTRHRFYVISDAYLRVTDVPLSVTQKQ
jgi:hypothetical protein